MRLLYRTSQSSRNELAGTYTLRNSSSVRLEGCSTLINIFASVTLIRKDLNTSASDAHINAHIRIVNKHRNVADKLGWEPRRKYATARFSIGFCALETDSTVTDAHCQSTDAMR